MAIKERVSEELKAAMLARNEMRVGALRLIRAEILKAEKEKGQAVDETREMAILQAMVKQRHDSIEQFEKAGRMDLAGKEKAELEIIIAYLPEPLSAEEVLSMIDSVLVEFDSPDPKQLGKIIGLVMGKLKAAGRPFDGKLVNERVRARLGVA